MHCFFEGAMQEVHFMEELETPSHLRTMASKLPFKLRDKWRTVVCDIQENSQMRAKFKDLVEFIERQSRVVLDPTFGDIQDLTDSKGMLKAKRPQRPPSKPSSRGNSFASTVAAMSERSEHIEGKAKLNQKEKLRQDSSSALKKPCLFCNKDHTMEICGALKHRPNKEKVEFTKGKGLCFGCWGKGHMGKNCQN